MRGHTTSRFRQPNVHRYVGFAKSSSRNLHRQRNKPVDRAARAPEMCRQRYSLMARLACTGSLPVVFNTSLALQICVLLVD